VSRDFDFWRRPHRGEHDEVSLRWDFPVGMFGVIHYFLYLRLRDAGHKKHIFNFLLFEVPVDYLRLGRKYAWSPWPAYFVWLVLVAGLILFIAGVFKLP
jgi:hypothetical protein